MNQPTLWEGPRVRATDPPTSRAAAESLNPCKLRERCARYLEVIRAAGDDGATRDEIAHVVDARGAEDRALSRRITDLHQAGLVVDSGRKRLSDSNCGQIVWVAA